MTTTSKQSKSALHVEDNKDWQRRMRELIKRAGYRVTQTDNLQDAVVHAQHQRYSVYVVDGSFPLTPDGVEVEGAGLQLYERIREMHGTDLNYVIISSSLGLERSCREKGIRFVNKLRFNTGSFTAYLEKVR